MTAIPRWPPRAGMGPSGAVSVSGAPTRSGFSLGRLPILAVVSACALLLLAFSDNAARTDHGWATPMFWAALIIIVVPIAARLLSTSAGREERLGLALLLGLALYLVKVLLEPSDFAFFQEFGAARTASDILHTHALFNPNPLATVNPVYPGLGTTTAAIVQTGQVRLFTAGIIIIGLARVALMLALFLLIEDISSCRVAGVTTLIYAANPNFLFFDSNYSYESLSLTLAAVAVLMVLRAQRSPNRAVSYTVAAAIMSAGLVITHHLTSYALLGLLAAWIIVSKLTQTERRWPLAAVGLFTLGAAVLWTLTEASAVLGYIGDVVRPAASSAGDLISGSSASKALFKSSTGTVAPLWERGAGFGSVALILLCLPFGLVRVWRSYRSQPLVLVLAGTAIAYPAALALRLTQAGTETSNRTSEFLFFGIALTIAVMVDAGPVWRSWIGPTRRRRVGNWPLWVAAVAACFLFVGGATIGSAPFERLPGRYLVGADSRSVDPESVAAARWVGDHLGPDNNILTDRTNRQLMGFYGHQTPVLRSAGAIPDRSYVHVSELITSPAFGVVERAIIVNRAIRYVIVDRRLSSALPLVGIYFERSEADAYDHRSPIPLTALTKFDREPGVNKVFDSRNIAIYDVHALGSRPVRDLPRRVVAHESPR